MEPRDYYVSLIRGNRTALLAGPFATHEAALAQRDAAWKAAEDVDPRAWFDACGTCSLARNSDNPKGVLNTKLGLKMED